jgi:hypothetical protein
MALYEVGAGQPSTFIAGADLSAKQWFLVELTAKDTVNATNAATDRAIGILLNAPASGQEARVQLFGSRMKVASDGSGTAIAVGDFIGPGSAGKAVKKATADYSTVGIANDISSADGTVIEIITGVGSVFRTAAG